MKNLHRWLVTAAFALIAVAAGAETYPAKPLQMIVPFPPGGGGDLMARIVGEGLSRQLGQPVIIQNRPGGDTIIGVTAGARAAPDGYTLLMSGDNIMVHEAFRLKLPYDSLKDIVPVSELVASPMLMIANPKLGVKSVTELIALARTKPSQIKVAHLGRSTHQYLGFKVIEQMAGVEFLEVPYKGTSPATVALLGGEVDVIFIGIGAGTQLVESGKAIALGVTSPQRVASLPKVPTVAEAGLAGYSFLPRFYIFVPNGTPKEIMTRLNTAIVAVLKEKAVADKLTGAGFIVEPSTPTEAIASLQSFYVSVLKLIQKAKLELEQ